MKNRIPFIIIFLSAYSIALWAQKPDNKFQASRLPFYQYAELSGPKDSNQVYELFRTKSLERLNANERIIDSLVAELNGKKRRIRNQYFPVVMQFEEKNAELRKRIVEYRPGNLLLWSEFRQNFIQEMDYLTSSIMNSKIEGRARRDL